MAVAKKMVRKAERKVVKGAENYAKGHIARGIACWALAALVAFLPTIGINLPAELTGYDTIAMVAFIIVGFLCFGRKLTVGRVIALLRTFTK